MPPLTTSYYLLAHERGQSRGSSLVENIHGLRNVVADCEDAEGAHPSSRFSQPVARSSCSPCPTNGALCVSYCVESAGTYSPPCFSFPSPSPTPCGVSLFFRVPLCKYYERGTENRAWATKSVSRLRNIGACLVNEEQGMSSPAPCKCLQNCFFFQSDRSTLLDCCLRYDQRRCRETRAYKESPQVRFS